MRVRFTETLFRNAQTIHALVKPTPIRRERWKMIKSAVLAAVAVVGIGAAAEAAVIRDYDIYLRYEGTAFSDIVYFDIMNPDGEIIEGDTDRDEMLPGTRSFLLGDLVIGQIINLKAKIVHPDFPEPEGLNGNGGRTPDCIFGSWNCSASNFTGSDFNGTPPDEDFLFAYADIWYVQGSSILGSKVAVNFWSGATSDRYTSTDGRFEWFSGEENSYFEVVAAPDMSPIPLPASAALLPLGIGALAMIRKRRKRVS